MTRYLGPLVRIRFLVRDAPYDAGQIVLIPASIAKRLVDAQRAEYIEAQRDADAG